MASVGQLMLNDRTAKRCLSAAVISYPARTRIVTPFAFVTVLSRTAIVIAFPFAM